jgi:nitronate monooxygenase
MTIQRLFGIELPIIQAPMAGVQGSAMAIAVSNAGGLGSLPCAMLSIETMRNELSAIRAHTDKPYNVNFFCHTMPAPDEERETIWRKALAGYYEEWHIDAATMPNTPVRRPFTSEAADVLAEFKPPVVSFHFGLPSADLIDRVKSWGAKVISSATTVEEAIWLESNGADAIIAQGIEAGGHRGNFLTPDLATQMGIFALLPQIVGQVKVPVIATGGIADAPGVRAALALGASAVQIGTSYLLCHEATTSKVYRAALQGEMAHHTALTNLFSGRPARGIVNRIMRELGPINDIAPAFPLATAAIAPLRAKAEQAGDGGFTSLWCGQNPTGCREIPAADMTRLLYPA